MRPTLLVLACTATLIGFHGAAWAGWPPEGVPLCSDCNASILHIVADGEGGAFVAWGRFGGDISLQRVTAVGTIAPGWPAEGLPVCFDPEYQALSALVPDGYGGVFVAWDDSRNTGPNGTTGVDIYVQRVQGNGTLAPGWAVDGMPATRALGRQKYPVVLGDGTGGAFVAWDDETLLDIYLQRLAPDGTVAPGWPVNGRPVCSDPAQQFGTQLVADGANGAILAWGDFRDGPLAVYGQRVMANGSPAPGWPVNGTRIVADRALRQLISDGAGGAYEACATLGPLEDDDYFVQRFTGAGAVSPGWPAGGAVVCQAPDERAGIRIVPDGSGGALVAWSDYRDSFDDEIFMLRMQGDGTRSPGWPMDGLRVTSNTVGDISPEIAPDGLGGAYLCWDRYLGPSIGDRTMLHHLDGNGVPYPVWPGDGLQIPSNVQTGGAKIAPDGMGGAILAWVRLGEQTVRALRLEPDGPVAVALSLVSAEASVSGVRLVWLATNTSALRAEVERRAENVEWQPLASLSPDGTRRLEYEDRDVTPGERYAYRLTYRDEGVELHTAETWVSVPRLELALEGFRPNPSRGEPQVALVLAEAGPAQLEMYDVAGRQVAAREVGSLGVGRHVVALGGAGQLAAGVYAMRLMQRGRVLTARGLVVR